MSSPYPKYHIMQRTRKVLFQRQTKCARCKAKATIIHHNDFSKTNHSADNLIPLCQSCHMKIHYEHGDLSHLGKCKIFYKGKTLKEWAKITGLQYGVLYSRFKFNRDLSPRKSKFEKIYGLTLERIGKKLGVTKQRVYQLHKEKKLENICKF